MPIEDKFDEQFDELLAVGKAKIRSAVNAGMRGDVLNEWILKNVTNEEFCAILADEVIREETEQRFRDGRVVEAGVDAEGRQLYRVVKGN